MLFNEFPYTLRLWNPLDEIPTARKNPGLSPSRN